VHSDAEEETLSSKEIGVHEEFLCPTSHSLYPLNIDM
jgi:hypothetical protein